MRRRLVKLSGMFMGVFSIFSLIQNGSPKMPTKINTGGIQIQSSSGTTVGNPNEGIILFDSNSSIVTN